MSAAMSVQLLADRNLGQANILHHRLDNGQTTRFRGESVNLIGASSDEASQAFNGIGAANGAMHDRWKGRKGQEMFFIFDQAPYGFRIALTILGFKCRQIQQRIFFLLLFSSSFLLLHTFPVMTMKSDISNDD